MTKIPGGNPPGIFLSKYLPAEAHPRPARIKPPSGFPFFYEKTGGRSPASTRVAGAPRQRGRCGDWEWTVGDAGPYTVLDAWPRMGEKIHKGTLWATFPTKPPLIASKFFDDLRRRFYTTESKIRQKSLAFFGFLWHNGGEIRKRGEVGFLSRPKRMGKKRKTRRKTV